MMRCASVRREGPVLVLVCVLSTEAAFAMRLQDPIPKPLQQTEGLLPESGYKQALGLYQKGDRVGAERVIRRHLLREPAHAQSHQLLGNILTDAGRYDDALAEFDLASRFDPRLAEVHHDKAICLQLAGRDPEAISEYQKAISLKADYHSAHKALGLILFDKGDLSTAVSHLEEATRLQPDDADSSVNLAQALYRLQRYADGLRHARRAAFLRPQEALAHYAVGLGLGLTGDKSGAIRAWREAIRLKPGFSEAHANLAHDLAEQGKVEEAIAEYFLALKLPVQPDMIGHGKPLAAQQLATLLAAKNRLAEARSVLQAWEENDGAEGHLHLGLLLAETGRITEAITEFAEAARLNPTSAKAHYNLGAAYATQKQIPAAIEAYRAALRLDPKHIRARENLANHLDDIGKRVEAISEYRAAIQHEPTKASLHFNLGLALQRQGEWESAIVAYRQAMRLSPDDGYPNAIANLLRLLRVHELWDDVLSEARTALAQYPKGAHVTQANFSWGRALERKGDVDAALQRYRLAIAAESAYAEPYYYLGRLLLDREEVEAAREAFLKACTLDPDLKMACQRYQALAPR